MRKSQVVEEWREEGRAEGRAEGRLQGRIEALHEILLIVLHQRFGQVPEAVVQRVRTCMDAARLRAAVEEALDIQSPGQLQL